MVKEIIFDSTSPAWEDDWLHNQFYLTRVMDMIWEILNYKGYIYLDKIYDLLGVKWNPDDENTCYRITDKFHTNFGTDEDGTIIVYVGII